MLIWWLQIADPHSAVDASGRLLMWGTEAPLLIKIYYLFWIINVLFVDSPYIPKLTFAATHMASVALALWSGEFFHVRLLTACHLFVIEGIFAYGAQGAFGKDFSIIPPNMRKAYNSFIQPFIAWICTFMCAGCFLLFLIGVK